MSKICVAGAGFDIDAKVVRWDEGPRYNAMIHACVNPSHPCPDGGIRPYSDKAKNTRPNRYSTRPALRRYGNTPPLEAVQAVVRQFIVHHDGCATAAMCFNVLQNERGLSCHFLMDNDGTIYQTMDLALMAYHAGGFNTHSVGIEICNRGDAKREPDYYRKKGQKRDTTTVRIHGHIYQCFQFTPPQLDAMHALAKAMGDEPHVVENRPLYVENFAAGYGILQGCLPAEMPDAGFYFWLATPIDDTEFARRLYAEEAVSVLPGSYLARAARGVNPGTGRVRLALVANTAECREGLARIARFAARL